MSGTYLGMPAFPAAARDAVRDTTLRANLRHATHTIRDKRAKAVAELDDWARLREAGRQIKDHTLRHLGEHLLRLEEAVTAAGGTVHWAADADEANRIVTPAIHRNRGEIRDIFAREMAQWGRPAPDGPPRSASRGRTSWSPRPAPWWSWSRRATGGCA